MSKFKVLQCNQWFMSSVLRIDVTKQTNQWTKEPNRFKSVPVLCILLSLFALILSSGVRTSNKSYDFTTKLSALLLLIAASQAFTLFLCIIVYMQEITALYQTLQSIVDDAAENEEIHPIYWRAEKKYRKYAKMLVIFFITYDQSAYVLTFISSIFLILSGNTDASTWPVVFELSIPFDTKTIFGWYMQLLIMAVMDFLYTTCMLFGTIQFIGYCIYIEAICEHFDLLMQQLQRNVEENPQNIQIYTQMSKAIQMHLVIYDIFKRVVDTNSVPILAILPPNIVVMATTMHQLHQYLLVGNFSGVLVFTMTLMCAFSWPYFFCFFADSAAARIKIIQRTVYDVNWYNFPPKLRNYFILIMAQAQRSIHFDGLNLVYCTLATFGMIIRRSISYYMTFNLMANR